MFENSRNKNGIKITAIFFAICLCSSFGYPKKTGQQRSYIEIDASNPFKVPKTSEYIDQPVPEYDESGNKKQETHGDEGLFHYKIGALDVQPENNYQSQGNENRNYDDSRNSPYNDQHAQYDDPEVPASQEESPQDTEPEDNNSNFNNDGEHTVGESRHYVPKGEWGQDERDNDQAEEGSHFEPKEDQDSRGPDEEMDSRESTGSRRDEADNGRERDTGRDEDMDRERGRNVDRTNYHESEKERGDDGNEERRDGDDKYEKDYYKESNNHNDIRGVGGDEGRKHDYD